MKKISSFLIFVFFLLQTVVAIADDSKNLNANEQAAVKKFVPTELTSKVEPINKVPLTLGDGINYWAERLIYNHTSYLAVLYVGFDSYSEHSCYLKLIKNANQKSPVLAPVPIFSGIENELTGCFDFSSLDLDGDGQKETLVRTMLGKNEYLYVFGWNGQTLKDLTPVSKSSNGYLDSVWESPTISKQSVNGKYLLIDAPSGQDSPLTKTSIYSLSSTGFSLTGSYDFFQIIEKKPREPVAITTLNPAFASEGTYTLDIKNVSDHSRAVRAEVTVNGSVVLKPQDFCSAPAHGKYDKKWWVGNDDDDDRDDDHCKRCIPKNEAYAIVNMKTANEIKVKVYGRGNSKIQLTLVKK